MQQHDMQSSADVERVGKAVTRKIVIRRLDRIETTQACGESGH